MKAQGAWARRVLDSINAKAAFKEKMSAFGSAFGVVGTVEVAGDKLLYFERAPGQDVFSLKLSEAGRSRALIDTAALIKAHGGSPYAIDWIEPSRDGAKVAVGISAGGSEDSLGSRDRPLNEPLKGSNAPHARSVALPMSLTLLNPT